MVEDADVRIEWPPAYSLSVVCPLRRARLRPLPSPLLAPLASPSIKLLYALLTHTTHHHHPPPTSNNGPQVWRRRGEHSLHFPFTTRTPAVTITHQAQRADSLSFPLLQKKPASTAGKAPASKAPAGKAPAKKAVKKAPATGDDKKRKRKTRKET